jgi:hypothetical protein
MRAHAYGERCARAPYLIDGRSNMASRPPPNNPQVVKVTMLYRRDTRTFVNTFHLKDSAGWDITKMQNAANDARDWWNTSYRLSQPAQVALYGVQVRLYDPANPLAYDLAVSPPIAGSQSGTSEAGNVTATISTRTGLAGRKFRGRMFVPGIAEVYANPDDTATSAFVAALAGAAVAFVGTAWHGGYQPAVWHFATNTATPIISAVISNILDSQRRRLPGRGR